MITLTKSRQPPPLWRRPEGRGLTVSPDARAILAIAGAVVLANILYLAGVFNPNPLGTLTGLGRVTSPGLLGGLPTIDPNIGFTSQALGHLAVHDWLHLQLPWWNPYEGTGTPLAGEMEGAALFPLTIFTAAANGQLYEHILLELVTGVATYLLLRRLAVSRWASTAAAIAFALNGTFAWFAHSPVNPIAFLPLLLLGIETAFSASVVGRSGGWSLIAIAGALSLYAGFPETTYIDSLFVLLWFAWRCGCADRRHLRAFATKAALGAIVAVLLAAPILVAFLDYLSHSYNVHAAIGNLHLPHAALPQLLLPYVYGPIFGFADPTGTVSAIWGSVGGYLSTSLLLFGLLGLVSSGRRGLRVMLLAWIVLAVARTYGEPPGLSVALGVLPDMSHVAFYRYADPTLELAVIVLAAFGMDSLTAQSAPFWRLVAVTAVSLAVLAAATVGAVPLAHKIASASHRAYSTGSFIWAVAVVAAGSLAAVLPSSQARRLLVASIISVDALVLFVLPELSAPRSVTIDTAPVAYLQRHQGLSRFLSLGPLQPNYSSYYRIRSLNANDALSPSAFASYLNSRLDPAVNPLVFTGTPAARAPTAPSPQQELLSHLNGYRAAAVRYVLAPAGDELPLGPTTFAVVFRSPTTLIYRLAGASSYFTATNRDCTVKAQSWESVRVSCSTPTTLVRRETYMPGWRSEVDGHARPVREYDDAFQAVTVGPGSHRVTFEYTPPDMHLALLGFAVGCLSLLAAPLLARRVHPPA
jgi:hypothetical protein